MILSCGSWLPSSLPDLLASDVQESRVCKVQPLGVTKNAVFQVDIDCVPFEGPKADDLGATGTNVHTFDSHILIQVVMPLVYPLQVNIFYGQGATMFIRYTIISIA